MHDTAMISGKAFCSTYGNNNFTVVDIGGKNVNGSLRNFFEENGMKYICLDIEEDKSVDVIINPGDHFPFDTGSIDLVVSTSCFEHDPCFWITFKEICRIVKKDGYIYVNAPSNGSYHCHPGDNWRFYSDAGQALAYWSGYRYGNEEIYPVKVIETFHVLPKNDIWIDFICIWQRVDTIDKEIIVSKEVTNVVGKMEKFLNDNKINTRKKFKALQKNKEVIGNKK